VGLSVVVTIVDGGPALARCLRGLAAQEGAPSLEVLIPYDDSVSEVAHLAEDFADFRFVDLGSLPTARPASRRQARISSPSSRIAVLRARTGRGAWRERTSYHTP
jgi:hypothetical protein